MLCLFVLRPISLQIVVIKLLHKSVQHRLGNLRGGPDDLKRQKWYQSFDFDAYLNKSLPAPWVPEVKDAHDTSSFNLTGSVDIHAHEAVLAVDTSSWDQDF